MREMSILKSCCLIGKSALIVSILITSGCSLIVTSEPDIASRNLALERWADCVERATDSQFESLVSTYSNIDAHCEGHKRDVAATFPAHMENQVVKRLSQRAADLAYARLSNAFTTEAWADSLGTRTDNIKVRLIEARQDDL